MFKTSVPMLWHHLTHFATIVQQYFVYTFVIIRCPTTSPGLIYEMVNDLLRDILVQTDWVYIALALKGKWEKKILVIFFILFYFFSSVKTGKKNVVCFLSIYTLIEHWVNLHWKQTGMLLVLFSRWVSGALKQ